MKPGRVFIHHDGALGDVLLSLPCIRKIRATAGFLHLACESNIGELLQHSGLANEISRVDHRLYSPLYADLPTGWSCGTLSSFDQAYLFTVRESRLAENLRQCIRDVRVIKTIPPADAPEHAAHFRFKQCGFHDSFADGTPLALPVASRVWAEQLLAVAGFKKDRDRLLVVHPGSGGMKKCWSIRNYLDLIHRLAGYSQLWCIMLSGPAEQQETISALKELAEKNPRVIHLHQEPLSHVAAVLNMGNHYLGNDSGISHLAGTLHCRGTVLFGPTNPDIWRPLYKGIDTMRFMQDGNCAPLTGLRLSELLIPSLYTKR